MDKVLCYDYEELTTHENLGRHVITFYPIFWVMKKVIAICEWAAVCYVATSSHWTYNAEITSLLRQSDVILT